MHARILPWLAATLWLCAGAALAGDLETGNAAFEHGDFPTALKLLTPLAQQGDVEAEIDVGAMYLAGNGVAKDHLQAGKWFLAAARTGNIGGEVDIGGLFASGDGIQKNYVLGYMWFDLAAAQGSAAAADYRSHVAAEMMPEQIERAEAMGKQCLASHFQQCGAEPAARLDATATLQQAAAAFNAHDPATAIRLYRPLADARDERAEVSLGILYATGQGVARDMPQALVWLGKSADQGLQTAQTMLGQLHEAGAGVPQDLPQALHWYELAAAHGDERAKHAMIGFFLRQHARPEDHAVLTPLCQAAASVGLTDGEACLAVMYADGYGLPQDAAQEVAWFGKAADQGDRFSQLALGAIYQDGHGVPADPAKAQHWFTMAAEAGDGGAMYKLGEMAAAGQGGQPGDVQAAKWLQLALVYLCPSARLYPDAGRLNADVAARLSTADAAEARRQADAWRAQHPSLQPPPAG